MPGGLARIRSDQPRSRRLTLVTSGLKDVIVPAAVIHETAPKRLRADRRSILGRKSCRRFHLLGWGVISNEQRTRQGSLIRWSVCGGIKWDGRSKLFSGHCSGLWRRPQGRRPLRRARRLHQTHYHFRGVSCWMAVKAPQ